MSQTLPNWNKMEQILYAFFQREASSNFPLLRRVPCLASRAAIALWQQNPSVKSSWENEFSHFMRGNLKEQPFSAKVHEFQNQNHWPYNISSQSLWELAFELEAEGESAMRFNNLAARFDLTPEDILVRAAGIFPFDRKQLKVGWESFVDLLPTAKKAPATDANGFACVLPVEEGVELYVQLFEQTKGAGFGLEHRVHIRRVNERSREFLLELMLRFGGPHWQLVGGNNLNEALTTLSEIVLTTKHLLLLNQG